MLTTNIKKVKIADSLRNNLLSNTLRLSKNNIENNNRTSEILSYNDCRNLNSFMNNNQHSLGEYTLSTSERTRNNNSNEHIFDKRIKQQKQILDTPFLNNLIFHNIEIKQYRNFIYYIQTTYNKIYGDYLKNIINNKEQYDYDNKNYKIEIKQLENLIARYSIIIFFLVKKHHLFMAKNIFLLMLKENNIYINFFYDNLLKQYYNIKNNRELINHGNPKSILKLIKIFSFILKYSLIFNLTNNRNIFLSKYLCLQKLNYKLFLLKSEIRGSLIVTDIGIKYLYASCLFNTCYYSILFYSSLTLPIKLSELIFKIYQGMNEVIFDKKEKSLLLKTSFNYALFIYLNGDNETALEQLHLIKEKLINYYDENFISDDEENEMTEIEDPPIINKQIYEPIKLIKKKKDNKNKSVSFKDKILIKRQETMKKLERKRGLSKSENTIDKLKEILFNRRASLLNFTSDNLFDPLHEAHLNKYNNSNLKKKSLRIDDIKKLFISDVKTILNKRNRKSSITERDIKNKQKIQKSFGVTTQTNYNKSKQSIIELRSSHTNFSSLLKINKLNVPKYMTDLLLIETEFLMCEIELDSKNIKEAYEHFKNSILILFIFRQNNEQNDLKSYRYFRKKLRIISVYLKEINKYIEEKNWRNKFQVIKNPIKNSKTYVSLNKKKFFKEKLGVKKSSLHLGRNHLLENIELNNKKKNKGDEYYNNLINKKISEEIEKLFLFLNTLSIYQIKILNDTQPKREIRNDLPIFFNGQFKDTLTTGQRNSLRNLNTMSISRNMILNNPDNLILPTNLKFSSLSYNEKTSSKCHYSNDKIMSRIRNHKLYKRILSLSNTIEYEYFKNIIFSKKVNKNLQQFFLENYSLVMKILKESRKNEINDIIKKPDILVDPINNYKKNRRVSHSYFNNYLIYYKEIKDLKKIINKINDFKVEESNYQSNQKDNDILIVDSENNNSISLSITNSSYNNNEDF